MQLQIISNKQKTFTFCDFDWRESVQNKLDAEMGKSGVYFTVKEKIYVWECGFSRAPEIIENYLLTGEEFPRRFRSDDSSFVLYDSEKNIVIAARDLIGVFPLFYFKNNENGNFVFSFSINALLDAHVFEPKINHAKIVEYIDGKLNEQPDNQTFYAGVDRILPGCSLKIDSSGTVKTQRCGTLDFQQYESFGDEQYIEEFRRTFVKSVEKNVAPHPKIAATLSGGLDSSSVCCVAQSLKTETINTFNFNTETAEAQEDEYIEAVVDKWHTTHQTVRSKYTSFDAVSKLISQTAQPHFAVNHSIQMDLIDEARKANCEVFLSGHWGDQVVTHGFHYLDELFDAGDWKRLKTVIEQRFERSLLLVETDEVNRRNDQTEAAKTYIMQRFSEKLRRGKNWREIPKIILILHRYFDCGLIDFTRSAWRKLTRRKIEPPPAAVDIIRPEIRRRAELIENDLRPQKLNLAEMTATPQEFMQRKYLEGIFRSNEIYGREEIFELYRQNSIRSVQPFFDANLMELNLSIPLRLKWGEGRKRNTLRLAMKNFLPEKVADRDTKGEFSNYHAQKLFELIEEFRERISENHQIWEIIDKKTFDKNVEILSGEKYHINEKRLILVAVSRTINLAIWLDYLASRQQFIRRSPQIHTLS